MKQGWPRSAARETCGEGLPVVMRAQLEIESAASRINEFSGRGGKPSGALRIMHVVASFGMGGTEHGLLKVIAGLGSEQFEHAICAVRSVDSAFVERLNMTPPVYCVGTRRSGFQFPLFRLAQLFRELRPDVVHSRNFGALEAVAAAKLAGIPVAIHSEHGYELEILRGLPLRRRILCHLLFKRSDAVLAVTDELRHYHARQSWLPEHRFQVFHNGVDTERFAPNEKSRARTRAAWGIPQERVVVGSVGRMVAIKDYGTLLRAAEIVSGMQTDIHVLLVGRGPQLDDLKRQASRTPALAGRFTFTGASDLVPDLLNALDVFVLPSVSEGMSNTILEAMSSGLPVVATRSGGTPEVIEDGQSGYLFAPRDAEGLARHIYSLVNDAAKRFKMGGAARRRAEERFSLPLMIGRYRNLYRELAARAALKTEIR